MGDAAGYFAKIKEAGMGTNVVSLVRHAILKAAGMGMANRSPSTTELNR